MTTRKPQLQMPRLFSTTLYLGDGTHPQQPQRLQTNDHIQQGVSRIGPSSCWWLWEDPGLEDTRGVVSILLQCTLFHPSRASSLLSALTPAKHVNLNCRRCLCNVNFNVNFNNEVLTHCHNAYNFSIKQKTISSGQSSSNGLRSQ